MGGREKTGEQHPVTFYNDYDSPFTQAEEGLHGKLNLAQKANAALLSSLLLPSVVSAAGYGALVNLSIRCLGLRPAL